MVLEILESARPSLQQQRIGTKRTPSVPNLLRPCEFTRTSWFLHIKRSDVHRGSISKNVMGTRAAAGGPQISQQCLCGTAQLPKIMLWKSSIWLDSRVYRLFTLILNNFYTSTPLFHKISSARIPCLSCRSTPDTASGALRQSSWDQEEGQIGAVWSSNVIVTVSATG